MLEFDKKKVVGKVAIELPLTEDDIANIMITGFEGGINYWASFRRSDNPLFADMPEDEPISTWATKVLLEGGSVFIIDTEESYCRDEKVLKEITLDKLLEGFKLNYHKRPHDNDLENGDATTADCIIQYAVFGDVIYG